MGRTNTLPQTQYLPYKSNKLSEKQFKHLISNIVIGGGNNGMDTNSTIGMNDTYHFSDADTDLKNNGIANTGLRGGGANLINPPSANRYEKYYNIIKGGKTLNANTTISSDEYVPMETNMSTFNSMKKTIENNIKLNNNNNNNISIGGACDTKSYLHLSGGCGCAENSNTNTNNYMSYGGGPNKGKGAYKEDDDDFEEDDDDDMDSSSTDSDSSSSNANNKKKQSRSKSKKSKKVNKNKSSDSDSNSNKSDTDKQLSRSKKSKKSKNQNSEYSLTNSASSTINIVPFYTSQSETDYFTHLKNGGRFN